MGRLSLPEPEVSLEKEVRWRSKPTSVRAEAQALAHGSCVLTGAVRENKFRCWTSARG